VLPGPPIFSTLCEAGVRKASGATNLNVRHRRFPNAYAYERSVSMSAAVRKLIAEHVPRKSEWFMARSVVMQRNRTRMWPTEPGVPTSEFWIAGGSYARLSLTLPAGILRLIGLVLVL